MVFNGGEGFLFEWGMIEDVKLLSVFVDCLLPGIDESIHMTCLFYCFSSIWFMGNVFVGEYGLLCFMCLCICVFGRGFESVAFGGFEDCLLSFFAWSCLHVGFCSTVGAMVMGCW